MHDDQATTDERPDLIADARIDDPRTRVDDPRTRVDNAAPGSERGAR